MKIVAALLMGVAFGFFCRSMLEVGRVMEAQEAIEHGKFLGACAQLRKENLNQDYRYSSCSGSFKDGVPYVKVTYKD